MDPADAAKWADVVMVLTPDEGQGDLYREKLAPNLRPGTALAFAHGLNIHFNLIEPRPDLDVFMIAPKGPGHTVRSEYLRGAGVPVLVAVHQDPSGNAWKSPYPTPRPSAAAAPASSKPTFKEECETDLFGEQVVLCGGLVELIRAGYETLVEAGYAPEMAYFECLPRSEADRRPDLRRRHRQHELLGQQHRRIRRIRLRPAHHHRRDQGRNEAGAGRHPERQFARDWMLENKVEPAELQSHAPPRMASSRSNRSARSCGR